MDPPISVPQPISDPCMDSRADSPPVDPPGVNDGSLGLTVRPQSGLLVSPICQLVTNSALARSVLRTIMLWGTLVFAKTTAPRSCITETMAASSLQGLNALPTYPMVESTPVILNWSLREIGRPCSGPRGLPSRWKYSSSSRARRTASSKRTSVKQFDYKR